MARKSFVLMVMGMVIFFLCSASSAQVPQLVNYQGKLTDPAGAPLNGNYQMVFTIYDALVGGTALWADTQAVVVDKGVFNVLLGSVHSIPYSIFDGSIRYLGIKVGGDPEITPRKPMVSVAYAMRAGSGGGEVNCHDCDTVFVNTTGPDSVVATTGTAFLGRVSGGSADPLYGVTGSAKNTSSGYAYGGYFNTSSEGTGIHCGLKGEGYGATNANAWGIRGYAENTSSGEAEGGSFGTSSSGTGDHIGVVANGNSNSTGRSYGVKGYAENYSSGDCYGGSFSAPGSGTGVHYGVRAGSYSNSSSSAYGARCYAENWSSGNAYAGYFEVYEGVGTGTPYGVYGIEIAGGGGAAVYASGDFAGSGAKYAVVKTGKGHRLLSCMESPEVWFEDFGEGQLVNGKAHIELDALFLETVTINADHPMKVFVQLKDDCKGTYVKTSNTGFDVIELQGGTSNASFSYRIVAKRKGYETERMRETDVGYDDPTLYPELQAEIDKAYQEEKQQQQLEREKRKQEEVQRSEEQRKMEEERTRMDIK